MGSTIGSSRGRGLAIGELCAGIGSTPHESCAVTESNSEDDEGMAESTSEECGMAGSTTEDCGETVQSSSSARLMCSNTWFHLLQETSSSPGMSQRENITAYESAY